MEEDRELELERSLAKLLKKRELAQNKLGVTSVPELDIEILKVEKQLLNLGLRDALEMVNNLKNTVKTLQTENKKSNLSNEEREEWKRRIEDDAQTIKQLKAINMRLRETKFGGNRDVLELEREKQLLLLKIEELNEKGPEKLDELREKNKSLKQYIGQLELRIDELEEKNLKSERPKRSEEELRKVIKKNAEMLEDLERKKYDMSEKEYKSTVKGLKQSTTRAQKDLETWAEFKKRRIESCIVCSNLATIASEVYYCSPNCMSEHHSK